jgi:predicted RNA-binding Zn-ribbon protein involved in translation (DUF1610 family)
MNRELQRIERMLCPGCGAEMNPHAEKPVVPAGAGELTHVEWTLGAVVEEIHQCPECGRVESRRQGETGSG